MQAQLKETNQYPAKLLVFPTPMGTPNIPQNIPPAPTHWWQRHGSTAQWVAAIIAILAFLISSATFGLTVYFHYADAAAKTTDEHVNGLIDNKLNPAKTEINSKIDTRADELGKKIDLLSNRISQVDGKLGLQISELKTKADQQSSLATLIDPNRALAQIRAEIEFAEKSGSQLPEPSLVDYKNAVQALPDSANEYWTTVAAIINYQSKLNQMSGEAPDPSSMSRRCVGLTNDSRMQSQYNSYTGILANCIVDLDTQSFKNVTFRNSVIRYSGGETTLINVNFVNCRFILSVAAKTAPGNSNLLMALLESGDKTSIGIGSQATQ